MSTLKTNTLSNVAGTASTAIENAINGSAKAWVNFNGTGTVAIRASYNVSSITDNGTGDYTVNFTNAMADANFSALPCGSDAAFGSLLATQTANTTSTVRLFQRQISQAAIDLNFMQVAIFR
jgi:hypothetical protein